VLNLLTYEFHSNAKITGMHTEGLHKSSVHRSSGLPELDCLQAFQMTAVRHTACPG